MALTKVAGDILDPGIVVAGIVTATGFSGPFSGGTDGNFTGDVTVGGNLTVNGDYTTLNTTLREVEILRVDTNSSTTAGIITQRGSGDILNLFDTNTEVFSVADGGNVDVKAGNVTLEEGRLFVKRTTIPSVDVRNSTNTSYSRVILQQGAAEGGYFQISREGTNSTAGAGANSVELNQSSNHPLTIKTNNTERLRISGIGSVGINNTSPATILDIKSAKASDGLTVTKGSNVAAFLGHNGTGDEGILYLKDGGVVTTQIYGETGHPSYFNAGNVGINSTSPGEKLDVVGNIDIKGGANQLRITSTAPAVKFTDSDASGGFGMVGVNNTSGSLVLRSDDGGALDNTFMGFEVDGSEKLRINSNGYSEFAGASDVRLTLGSQGTAGSNTANWVRGQTADLMYNAASGSHIWEIGGSEKLRITSAGNLKLPDDAKIQIGGVQTTSGDLEIYHTASGTSWIRHYNTSEYFVIEGNQIDFRDYTNAHYRVRMGAAVELRHNNEERLKTSSTGVTITGEVASSQDYPNFRPTLDFNFAAVKKLDSRITYQRTGPASYVDEFGIVKLVGANTPRFDHDPITRESKGLLIEESRINRFASSDPAHSAWTTSPNGTTNTGDTTDTKDPAGTYTATKLTSVASANSGSQIYDGMSRSSGGVQSLWAKKGTHNVIGIYDYSGGTGIRAWYDLNTGEHRCEGGSKVAAGVQSEGNDTNDSWMIEYPNGWYRCIYYEAANMTWAHFRICDFDSDTESSSSANSVYLWGLQAEDGGVTYATSHIPCNTGLMPGTVTRGADTAFIDGQDFTDLYNVPEGTFVLKQSVDDTSTANQWGWGVEKSTNRSGFFNGLGFRVGGGGAGYVGAWYMNNGSQQAFFNMNAGALINIPFVSALAYKVNDMAATTSGITVLTDTSATIADAGEFDRFSLGSYYYDAMSTGHIQRVMYYPKRLSNNQLVTLTS